MEHLKRKFLDNLCSFELCGGVLVALSGGADSVCLLDLFVTAKAEGKFPCDVEALHVNHQLRGEESDRDETFCKELCARYGVKLSVVHADVNSIAKELGLGIEEAARRVRYNAFSKALCENENLSHIATAHNKGDMCETMILNLARGTSLDGLSSIPRQRGNIIRPILFASRSDILAYNNEKGLSFVTDSTNLDTLYSRNRVRLNVLPEIEKIYSGYEDNFERTAKLLLRDAEFLENETVEKYGKVVKDGVLYTQKAQNFHISILSRVIKRLYNYYGFVDLTEAHIDALCEKIKLGKQNFKLSMHGCTAVCERGKLRFLNDDIKPDEFSFDINVGESVLLPCKITVSLSKEKSEGAYPLKESAFGKRITVRSRKDGDMVVYFNKTHKIKRIISDKKLSVAEKNKLFFLCSDGEIIYSNLPVTADKAFARRGDECIYIAVKEVANEQ
ncbi:MAG: tRNA lysidine(34) synthetase TilS [Clostridia bacterium]|nr:tRNA lysidine(34) synthetase TilS [Clostridia bacterium]